MADTYDINDTTEVARRAPFNFDSAESLINGIPTFNHGLDVFYFAGSIMSDGQSVNFAKFPWKTRSYSVASTNWGA